MSAPVRIASLDDVAETEAEAPVRRVINGGAWPETILLTGISAGTPDGTWMNGALVRVADINSMPAWERLENVASPLNKISVHTGTPGVTEYFIDHCTRANTGAAWSPGNTIFAPNAELGMPWEVSWSEDGSYSGEPVFVAALPVPGRMASLDVAESDDLVVYGVTNDFDGAWMNGTYQRGADFNEAPLWELIEAVASPLRKMVLSRSDIGAPYDFELFTRANTGAAWVFSEVAFLAGSTGLPWLETWAQMADFVGPPSVGIFPGDPPVRITI